MDSLSQVIDEQPAASKLEREEDFVKDFIGGTSLQDELEDLDSQVGDLQSLNLFGVEMSADQVMGRMEKRGKGASKEEVQKVLTDLVQMVAEIDPKLSPRPGYED